MRLSIVPSALPLLAAFGLAACSTPIKGNGSDLASSTASLVRAASCADLTTNLRDDANAKIDASIDHAIAMVRAYGPSYWWHGYARGGIADAGTGAPVASPASPGANAGSGAASTPKASTFTDTNTQVAGVDEADIAKTDGRYLWVLHGSQLRTMKAFPTAQLADLGNGSALDLEGLPMEMFVHEGKAVVFSRVDGTALYQRANLPNRGEYNDVQALGAPVASDGYPGSYPYYRPVTKVTVLSVENNAPRVLSEQYFEGNYVSSRRVDNQVRIVLTGALHEPRMLQWDPSWYTQPATIAEAVARLETVRVRLHASVNATTYRDWLPVSFVRSGANTPVADAVACADMYFPQVATTQAGVTQVHTLDLGNVSAGVRSTGILGDTDVVYGNAGELVLASRAWYGGIGWATVASGGVDVAVSPSPGGASGGSSSRDAGSSETPAALPPPQPSQPGGSFQANDFTTADGVTWTASTRTHLHRFGFASTGQPTYVASGSVPGYLKDQFAIDSKDGFVRVTTTEDFALAAPPPAGVAMTNSPPRVNHLFTLATQGGSLALRGDAGPIAPTEQIYSTRFVGNTAYVVTFRQTDPLFVFDLTNPATPVKLGELKIPGFSEYMQPIDGNHLLTIGKDANEQGRVTGLAIQLFDVTNKTQPRVQGKFVFGNDQGWASSEAENNHKAFTWSPVNKMLAIPMQRWTNGSYAATFEFFKVDVTNNTGASVDRLGFVDHAQIFGRSGVDPNMCGYTVQPRRTFFYENDVVTLSTAGAVANRAADLGRIATAQLPSATSSSGGSTGGAPRPDMCAMVD
jgi:predicted small secreted protein